MEKDFPGSLSLGLHFVQCCYCTDHQNLVDRLVKFHNECWLLVVTPVVGMVGTQRRPNTTPFGVAIKYASIKK